MQEHGSNALLQIRDDGRGRHTTVHRQLLILPGGEILIDTPGLRELQLWDAEGGTEATFADIELIAAGCKFSDCRHEQEPGCAVRVALADGSLDAGRFGGWAKIQGELGRCIQGNLDPQLLVAGGGALTTEVDRILRAATGGPFVFNLGHGIPKTTPPEHVAALVAQVQAWRS